MPFDVEGARKSGYTEGEIADHLAQQSRFDAGAARKSGYTDAEIITHLRPAAKQFDAQPTDRDKLLSSAPMRFAKGMKDPIDGLAEVARASAEYSPASMLMKAAGGRSVGDYLDAAANFLGGKDSFLGDVLGVKGASQDEMRQENASSNAEYEAARKATGQEGFDAVRLAGNVASPANVLAARAIPAAPITATTRQIATRGAMGGAIGAGSQPTTGDNFLAEKAGQVALGAAGGGVLAPAVAKLGDVASRALQRYRAAGTVNVTPEGLRLRITRDLQADGVDPADIPEQVFQRLTGDVQRALQRGQELDPAAALRQMDFQDLSIPALRGQVTRSPMDWQREVNLAGVEGVGKPIQGVLQQQSRGIQGRFNQGARNAMERFDAGEVLGGELRQANQTAERNVRAAYDAFRNSTGRDLEVPLQGLAQDYARTLETFGEAIPGAVRKQFDGLGLLSGTQRRGLTVEQAENLIKAINANTDPANKVGSRALGELRGAVQRSITDAADSNAAGAEAAALASEARGLAAQRFRTIEDTPALRAAIDGMEPDQFVQRFVTGGKVNEIQRMQELLGPEGRDQVRAQTVAFLRDKAFGANAAGDGKAAQASFNDELRKIGRPKLIALLGEEGADEMYRIGRVLAYIKQVPEGATPNTSGTGQMITSMLGKMRGMNIPYLRDFVIEPINRMSDRSDVAQALAGAPQSAAELDPQTVQALRSLFAPVPVVGGAALGYSSR